MKSFKFFTQPIFYGSSNSSGTGKSDLDIAEVNDQIKEIHNINSGLQQPCHCHYNCNCETQQKAAQEMKNILAKSVKKALSI